MKKTSVLFQSNPNFSDNARALYEFMKSKYGDKINYYWVIDNLDDYNRLKDKINCVLNDSSELYKLMPCIDIIFTTHGQLVDRKLDKQIYVNLWHGVGMKKAGFLLSEKNMASGDREWYEKLQIKTDYIIVPNKFFQLIFSCLFKTDYTRVLPL